MDPKLEHIDEVLAALTSTELKPVATDGDILDYLKANDAKWENEGYYLLKILNKLIREDRVRVESRKVGREMGLGGL